MYRKTVPIILLMAVFALAVSAGCGSRAHMNPDYGKSINSAFYSQRVVKNPADMEPVEGVCGDVAANIYQRYVDSFTRGIPDDLLSGSGDSSGGSDSGSGAAASLIK